MKRFFIYLFFVLIICSGPDVFGAYDLFNKVSSLSPSEQDTIRDRQLLYNGVIWKNIYHRIDGDQFLFSGFFIPASISINGKTFRNVRIKYDILSDEIITPVNGEDILQLNKEMVDSFTLSFKGNNYKFINIRNDTLKNFTGYMNILYKGNSAFYLKFKKSISPASTPVSDGYFIENQFMYLVKDNLVYPISSSGTLIRILNKNKDQIRGFIRKNKLRVSKKIPESFVPVIRFYDSIGK